MNSAVLLATAICVFYLGYRFYSRFLGLKVTSVDESRPTPAVRLNDGKDYIPTKRGIVFFYHYATIAGAGVLVGPTLAAQYGWLPCVIWILAATCLAGGVHDFVVMLASVRHDGKTLGQIALAEVGKLTGSLVSIATIFLITTAIAGLGLGVVKALELNPWGTFSVVTTIPIALLVGFYLRRVRPGKIIEASLIGIVLVLATFVIGSLIPTSWLAGYFRFDKEQLTILIGLYAFVAAIMPVDMLLTPRDYLSAYIKAGVIALLVIGFFVVRPDLKMLPVTQYVEGGGPIISGGLWPFLFIVITCGAVSGWHSLCCSGVSPKLISNERDIRPVAYGGWLLESLCAVLALCLASMLIPSDYFAINAPLSTYAMTGMTPAELPRLSRIIGMELQGRTGGTTSLAVGMGLIFSNLFGGEGALKFCYMFAVVFLGIFTMPIMDHGTRMSRYLLQETFARVYKPFRRTSWLSSIIFTAVATTSWVYLLYTGGIGVLWPMFGICNQLLASIGLTVGTIFVIRRNKPVYGLVTFLPMLVFVVSSTHGAILKVMELSMEGTVVAYVQAGVLLIVSVLVVLVVIDSIRKWIHHLARRGTEKP